MEIITTIALITINETLIVQAISFLIFLFILNRIMIAPLRAAIDDRSQYMEQARMDIIAAEQKVSKLTDEISNQENAAKKEAFDLSRELEKAGDEAATDIISKTRQTIAAEKERAFREIDAQIIAARKSIRAEAEILSVRVMEKILSRGLSR
jgi:F-type H+-transporting ATPase subunit b